MAADPNQKKVVVNFQSVANAPKLRQSKFKGVIQMIPLKEKLEVIRQCFPKIYSNQIISAQIGGNEKFAKVIEFLRRQIHQDTVFLYVNSAFSPNPDELIMDLYNNFGIDGQLVVNYASSLAWG